MPKTALITGAARGIGAGLAVAFARAGYQVAVNCRTQESLEQRGLAVAEQCRALGAGAVCFVADVSDFAACAGMVSQVVSRLGGIDVLVNNAGITRDGLAARMSEADYDAVLDANLKSVFNMIRHVSPVMMRQRHGKIINMTSVVGINGNKGQLNYAASKAGVIGITKSVAKELGSRGITCNAIAPGFIQSEMTDSLSDKLKAAMLSMTSLGRFGTVEDVARTALFLAESDFITGQVLVVDGGLSM